MKMRQDEGERKVRMKSKGREGTKREVGGKEEVGDERRGRFRKR